jgi:hypothetical protein
LEFDEGEVVSKNASHISNAPVLAANLPEPEFSFIARGAIMADESVSQNFSENPDPQEKQVSGDDSTPSQEQPRPLFFRSPARC